MHAGRQRNREKLDMTVDVIVTSYDTIRTDNELFVARRWDWMVLDEGHTIRNAASKTTQAVKRVQASHRLVLTGTPIQNSVVELWSIFDFLMPGFLGTRK